MNKFKRLESSSKLIQRRLATIEHKTRKSELFSLVKNSKTIIIPLFLLIVSYIILLSFAFSSESFKDGDFIFNIQVERNTSSFSNLNIDDLLGTGPLGRRNSELFLSSVIVLSSHIFIFWLSSILLGIFIFTLSRKLLILGRLIPRVSFLEGIILLPIILFICSLFFKTNYLAILFLTSIPAAFTFAFNLSFKLKEIAPNSKFLNNRTNNYISKATTIKTIVIKTIFCAFSSFYRSTVIYTFWLLLFTYLGLFNYGDGILENGLDLGYVFKEATNQATTNPFFLLVISLTTLFSTVLLTILATAIEERNVRK